MGLRRKKLRLSSNSLIVATMLLLLQDGLKLKLVEIFFLPDITINWSM
jgi:hypothetical protein